MYQYHLFPLYQAVSICPEDIFRKELTILGRFSSPIHIIIIRDSIVVAIFEDILIEKYSIRHQCPDDHHHHHHHRCWSHRRHHYNIYNMPSLININITNLMNKNMNISINNDSILHMTIVPSLINPHTYSRAVQLAATLGPRYLDYET